MVCKKTEIFLQVSLRAKSRNCEMANDRIEITKMEEHYTYFIYIEKY